LRERLRRSLGEPLLFLLAAALWLAPLWRHPDGFAFWRPAAFSDLLISHFPNAEWVRRSIAEWGVIPLWNAQILSGAPFAADPLAGIFYPPAWLGILLPAGLGFNLFFLLHLAWAGWGAAKLAAEEGAGREGRILAGLLFAGTPKTLGHVGLGHLGLVGAVCWTPWLLLAAVRAVSSARLRDRSWPRRAALAGALGGLVFLADPRWLVPAALTAGSYALWRYVSRGEDGRGGLTRAVGAAAVASGFALALSAALALPLVELSSLSTRQLMTSADRTAMQLPAAGLAGLLIPDLAGWPEWLPYAGIVTAALAIGAALRWRPGSRFWSLAALASWALALGNQTPLYSLFEAIVPGAGLLRVPPRFLWISALALSLLAAHGLDGLASAERRRLPREAIGPLGIALGMATIALVHWRSEGTVQAALGGAAVLSIIVAIWVFVSHRVSPRLLPLGVTLIAVLDLLWVGLSLLEVRPRGTALADRTLLAERIEGSDGSRVFSPSYSLPQQTAALARLELADGVNPLQVRAYADSMAGATGFDATHYAVTLPPFPSEGPRSDWRPRLGLAELGLLSVGTIVADYPLEAEGLEATGQVEGVYLYSNPEARPRAWVEALESAEGGDRWEPVRAWEWSPNRISARAEGPGLVVFSEIAYPGWRAIVDGEPADLETAHGILRAVPIPAGEHQVTLEFRPWRVTVGILGTLVGVVALAVLWIRR
jgi:hypothetical protein